MNFFRGPGGCCPQRADGVTYLKVGDRGVVVGLTGLDALFGQLYTEGRHPDDLTDDELIQLVRARNYIPHRPEVEADYAAALRRAYVTFCQRQDQLKENQSRLP
ncbi:MAG: hypothetical protein Kow00124_12490 [Anaerolineae bacterium]